MTDDRHVSDVFLRTMLDDSPVRACSSWRHRKTGGRYHVVCVAVREADLVPLVVYQNSETLVTWARPVAEFVERFDREE